MDGLMPGAEHQVIKNFTTKNMIITIVSTASIVVSVMTTYFNLKSDIADARAKQETADRVTDVRLKVLEEHVLFLQKEVDGFYEQKK